MPKDIISKVLNAPSAESGSKASASTEYDSAEHDSAEAQIAIAQLFTPSELEQLKQASRDWDFTGEIPNEKDALRQIWTISSDQTAAFAIFCISAAEATLEDVVTNPAQRRQGYAHRLLRAAFQHFQDSGIELIFLEVRVSNLPAIQLYHSLGFESGRVRRAYYSDGEDALEMALSLQNNSKIEIL